MAFCPLYKVTRHLEAQRVTTFLHLQNSMDFQDSARQDLLVELFMGHAWRGVFTFCHNGGDG
jgi:hypothetical protein